MTEKTHWLKTPNKNYFGVWDIPESGEITLTIKSAGWENVTDPTTNRSELKRVARFVEKDFKPLICNQTNAKSIVSATKCKYIEDTVNKPITLIAAKTYDRKNRVEIDCVRIKNETPVIVLPTLVKDSEAYKNVVAALEKGYTIDQIKNKYTLTPEIETELCKNLK